MKLGVARGRAVPPQMDIRRSYRKLRLEPPDVVSGFRYALRSKPAYTYRGFRLAGRTFVMAA